MVGIPASGKSTLVEMLMKVYPTAFVYSTDAEIERMAKFVGKTYDEVFPDYIKKAEAEMNLQLEEAAKNNRLVIWDQTNLTAKKRKAILARVNAKKNYCICFEPPREVGLIAELTRRLENRPGKTIPENILASMFKSYVEPSLDEGFDQIQIFDINRKKLKESVKT
jgi:tRNA uridine 5-carbamoylmethylation protein Kti12